MADGVNGRRMWGSTAAKASWKCICRAVRKCNDDDAAGPACRGTYNSVSFLDFNPLAGPEPSETQEGVWRQGLRLSAPVKDPACDLSLASEDENNLPNRLPVVVCCKEPHLVLRIWV